MVKFMRGKFFRRAGDEKLIISKLWPNVQYMMIECGVRKSWKATEIASILQQRHTLSQWKMEIFPCILLQLLIT